MPRQTIRGGSPPPPYDPKPHPRDAYGNAEWFRRHGADSAQAWDYAARRCDAWTTERSHLYDKLALALVILLLTVLAALMPMRCF
jgi:hypothetical protein